MITGMHMMGWKVIQCSSLSSSAEEAHHTAAADILLVQKCFKERLGNITCALVLSMDIHSEYRRFASKPKTAGGCSFQDPRVDTHLTPGSRFSCVQAGGLSRRAAGRNGRMT